MKSRIIKLIFFSILALWQVESKAQPTVSIAEYVPTSSIPFSRDYISEVDFYQSTLIGKGFISKDKREGIGMSCFNQTPGPVCDTIYFIYFNFVDKRAYQLPEAFWVGHTGDEKENESTSDEKRLKKHFKKALNDLSRYQVGKLGDSFYQRKGWNWISKPRVMNHTQLNHILYTLAGIHGSTKENLSTLRAMRTSAADPADLDKQELCYKNGRWTKVSPWTWFPD